LDQPAQAHAALNLALKGELTREQHVETIATLVQACLKQGLYIEALNLLEGTQAWQLSQQESVELRLLRARLLRTIGLLDKAVAVLADQMLFIPNPDLKVRVALELGRCYSAQERDDLARETLSQPFALVEPGPLALELGAALSEVSLRLGRSQQAASVCDQLLAYAEPGGHRDRLLKLQAEAYRQQERYDRAILAVIGQSNDGAPLAPTAPGATPDGVAPQ
jgi:tetratricopeptide (TPR) repeat protein